MNVYKGGLSIDQESKELLDELVKISLPSRDNSMDDIMYEEVEMAKGLKKRKSPGYDRINEKNDSSGRRGSPQKNT